MLHVFPTLDFSLTSYWQGLAAAWLHCSVSSVHLKASPYISKKKKKKDHLLTPMFNFLFKNIILASRQHILVFHGVLILVFLSSAEENIGSLSELELIIKK